MKRLLVLFITVFSVLSCADQLEDNTPAIQGYKDGVLWKATTIAADIDFGGFVIEGKTLNERVQLITTDDTRGTFNLGVDSNSIAIYVDANGTIFSTKNAPNTDVHLSQPEGQIVVEDIDSDDPKGIYGTFWFNAYTADGLNAINFNRGVFYNTPLIGGLVQIQN